VLPVSGVDEGTLRHRLDGPGGARHVVRQDGHLRRLRRFRAGGALRTRDRGVVYFAILNHNVPIEVARKRQDAFVRALLASQHTDAWPYQRDEAPAFTRAEVVRARP